MSRLVLNPLNLQQIRNLFSSHYAKYLSQHDPSRHYRIDFREVTDTRGEFVTTTCKYDKILGQGYGQYAIRSKFDIPDGPAIMDVKYDHVFDSPHITSPMCPQNSFYPQLRAGYTLGPFYTSGIDIGAAWQPVIYSHLQKERAFKVLNFYHDSLTPPEFSRYV